MICGCVLQYVIAIAELKNILHENISKGTRKKSSMALLLKVTFKVPAGENLYACDQPAANSRNPISC
jgi:hypothetical protein